MTDTLKGKLRLRHIQREDHMKVLGEDGHVQAKERETNPANNTLILDI